MEFLGRVPEVKTAVGSALLKLGDGNWKMGEGITVPKTARLGEGDEDLILENFICQFSPNSDPSPFHFHIADISHQLMWLARQSRVL